MSNLSRRLLVASAAALPALAVPAVAVEAPTEPDPIYAAIETHGVVSATWVDALKRCSRAGGDLPPQARIYLYDRPKIEATFDGDVRSGVYTVTRRLTEEFEPLYANYDEHIKEYAPRNLSDAERDAWIKMKCEELHAEQQRFDEEFAQTSAGKIRAESDARADEEWEAQDALYDTTPTTIEGLVTLLRYFREDQYLSESGDEKRLAHAVERALCQFAGLPEPPPWWDQDEEDQDEEEAELTPTEHSS